MCIASPVLGHNVSGGDAIALEIAPKADSVNGLPTKNARLLARMGPLGRFAEIGFHLFGFVLLVQAKSSVTSMWHDRQWPE
jgi:hypothetical protein